MKIYRTKAKEVEALQWTGENWREATAFSFIKARVIHRATTVLEIWVEQDWGTRQQGWIEVPLGSWLVRSPGEDNVRFVSPEQFAAKYEKAPMPKPLLNNRLTYLKDRRCRICGETGATSQYQGGVAPSVRRSCQECGFSWREEPLHLSVEDTVPRVAIKGAGVGW